MVSVSIATMAEISQIIALAKQYDGQFSKHITVDVDYAIKAYTNLVNNGMMTVFALKDKDRIIGGLAGLVFPDINSGLKTAVECFWFVNPADRGEGMKLLDIYERWAKQEGCHKIAVIHLEDSFPKALEKLYARRGYALVEKHYVKQVEV